MQIKDNQPVFDDFNIHIITVTGYVTHENKNRWQAGISFYNFTGCMHLYV